MTDIPLILLQNTHPFHCCLFQNNRREGGGADLGFMGDGFGDAQIYGCGIYRFK